MKYVPYTNINPLLIIRLFVSYNCSIWINLLEYIDGFCNVVLIKVKNETKRIIHLTIPHG